MPSADPQARHRAHAGEVRHFVHTTHLNQAGALVHVYQDGSVHLNHGGTEMGQGLFIRSPRWWPRNSASGSTREDHRNLDRQGAEHVARRRPPPAPISTAWRRSGPRADQSTARRFASESWKSRRGRSRSATIASSSAIDRCRSPNWPRRRIWRACRSPATGFYKTPKIHWDRARVKGRPFFYFAYGAACCEVPVDITYRRDEGDARRHPP